MPAPSRLGPPRLGPRTARAARGPGLAPHHGPGLPCARCCLGCPRACRQASPAGRRSMRASDAGLVALSILHASSRWLTSTLSALHHLSVGRTRRASCRRRAGRARRGSGPRTTSSVTGSRKMLRASFFCTRSTTRSRSARRGGAAGGPAGGAGPPSPAPGAPPSPAAAIGAPAAAAAAARRAGARPAGVPGRDAFYV